MFSGEGIPTNIARRLQNKSINSVWYSINGTSWPVIATGVLDDKAYISVGTLTKTLPGDSGALTRVVLVYDYQKDTWDLLDGHPASQWSTYIDSGGDEVLLFGDDTAREVYDRGTSYDQDGSAITMVIRTKYYDMDTPEYQKKLYDLFVTYRPQNDATKYLTVKTSVDGTNEYTEQVGSATDSKLSMSGAVTVSHAIKRVSPENVRGHNISYEFSNSDDEFNVALLGFTQQFRVQGHKLNIAT